MVLLPLLPSVSVSSRQEVMVHVPKVVTHQRVQHQHVEQTVEIPVPQVQELRVHNGSQPARKSNQR